MFGWFLSNNKASHSFNIRLMFKIDVFVYNFHLIFAYVLFPSSKILQILNFQFSQKNICHQSTKQWYLLNVEYFMIPQLPKNEKFRKNSNLAANRGCQSKVLVKTIY